MESHTPRHIHNLYLLPTHKHTEITSISISHLHGAGGLPRILTGMVLTVCTNRFSGVLVDHSLGDNNRGVRFKIPEVFGSFAGDAVPYFLVISASHFALGMSPNLGRVTATTPSLNDTKCVHS